MECKSASTFMMKYMDAILSQEEAADLNAHLKVCVVCKEDFLIYEKMTEEFELQSANLFEPPIDFENCVREKIACISSDYCKMYSSDTVMGFIFGAFSMLFGIGIMLSMFKTEIIAWGAQYPYIKTLMDGAAVFSEKFALFANDITQKFLFFLNGANSLIDASKYAILAIIGALVVAQYFVYSKNKVEI